MATKRSTNSNKPSLKSQGAGYSTTNRKGETTFYKSSKDASGYSDTRDGKNVGSSPGNPISRFDASGKQISVSPMPADSFTSTGKPNLPSKTQTSAPDIGLGAVAPGLGATLKDGLYESTGTPGDGSTESLAQQTNQNQLEALRSMVSDTLGIKPPSLEKDYLKAEKKAGINDLQNSVNTYTSQLNNIIATRDQNLLRVEGQGRGIPEVIIGGQQAQIKKEAAIEALPVQAALDAAQGNLQMAQNRLDKLFAIHREDVQNDYNFKKGIVDSLYNFATQSEQRRFEAALADQKIKRDEKMENLKQIQEWSRLAVQTGQSYLISEFGALDLNSPNVRQDFARLQSLVRMPSSPVKRDTQVVNGQLIDMQTGEVISSISDPAAMKQASENLSLVNDIENVLSDAAFDKTFGGFLTNTPGWSRRKIGGTEENTTALRIENIRAQLALGARGELKGQGAVSDFEGKLLSRAQSALDIGMNPTDARYELAQAKGALRTSSGLTADVLLTNPSTGESMVVTTDQAGILSAIQDGLKVEYQ